MFSIENSVFDRELTYLDLPAIRVTLTIPAVSGGRKRAAKRIGAFYAHMADALETHTRKNLLPQAASSFGEALERSRYFEPWRVKMSFSFEQTDDELTISRALYGDLGGDERERIFTDVWDSSNGLLRFSTDAEFNYRELQD